MLRVPRARRARVAIFGAASRASTDIAWWIHGIYPAAPRTDAAVHAQGLSDAELGHIYVFLKSIPQPPPAKSIPLLN
jgi:hypothetical protein